MHYLTLRVIVDLTATQPLSSYRACTACFGFSLWYAFCLQKSVGSLKSRTWSVGADVVIYLSTGQDGNIHMTWLCVLASGLAMVVFSSGSVLVSITPPVQQAYKAVINHISSPNPVYYTTQLERSFLASSLKLDSTTRNLYKSVWGKISGGGHAIYT